VKLFAANNTGSLNPFADGAPTQLKVGDSPMSKEQRSNRETKKVAAMTPKEKKAAKRAKKEQKGILGT
jgi:hypothetical protein